MENFYEDSYAACRLFDLIKKTASDDAAKPEDIDTLIEYYKAFAADI